MNQMEEKKKYIISCLIDVFDMIVGLKLVPVSSIVST